MASRNSVVPNVPADKYFSMLRSLIIGQLRQQKKDME